MKRSRPTVSSLRVSAPVLSLILLVLVAGTYVVCGAPPAWWTTREVLNGQPADDYAAANLGQLKHIATKAAAELNANLPGGAGGEINNLITAWSAAPAAGVLRDDYSAVNLGQLKFVAKPFYDRLIAAGYPTTYPWANAPQPPDDHAAANLGQLKSLFAFELSTDTDADGLFDWWEMRNWGHLGVDPTGNADGDDFDNLQEFSNGTDPNDFYNGVSITLTLVSGGGQSGTPGTFLPAPLVVSVKRSDDTPWVGAPVTFRAGSVPGGYAAINDGSVSPVADLSIFTDSEGKASAYFRPTASVSGQSLASTGSKQVSFVLTGYAPNTAPTAHPVLQTSFVSSTQTDLSWTSSASNSTGFKVERWTLATGWQTVATVTSQTTNYSDTYVPSGIVAYRVSATSSQGSSPASKPQSSTGVDLASTDTDDDGLSDADEIAVGSDPENPDSDNDGVKDGEDVSPRDPDLKQPRVPESRYALIDLTSLGFRSPVAINDSSQILDNASHASGLARIWSNGQFIPIPSPNSDWTHSWMQALSNAGGVVDSYSDEGKLSAWSASSGAVRLDYTFAGLAYPLIQKYVTPTSLTASGMVLANVNGYGAKEDDWATYSGVVRWNSVGGTAQVIGDIIHRKTTDGVSSHTNGFSFFPAKDENRDGVIVGTGIWTTSSGETWLPALYRNGAPEALPKQGQYPYPRSINNLPHPLIVGDDSEATRSYPVLWAEVNGQWMEKILGPYNPATQDFSKVGGGAYKINDRCEIVGTFSSWDGTAGQLGSLWQNGKIVDLADRTVAGYKDFYTKTINNKGVILAQCIRVADGQSRQVLLLPVDIVPDFNRDGVIDDKDRGKVTESEPWRWWLNDDDDAGTTDGDDIPERSDYGDRAGGSLGTAADYGTNDTLGHIDGVRDLVDFFPLYLDIKKLLEIMPPGPNAKYKLKQEDGALNFSYTDLKANSVRDFLTKRDGTKLDNATTLASWEVHRITSTGFELHTDWLNAVKGVDGYGLILLEGRAKSTKPLVLEVSDSQGKKLVELKFQVSIDSVEQMFRHKNLLAAGGGSGGPSDRLGEPANYPDRLTSNKTFVMVHGYNVNAESARGWGAEMFKRLYWTGSKAKFYNVTWYGSETQILGSLTTDYQANVDNAFATAQQFASFLSGLSNVTVAGHSLGNMLVGSAIHDWGARPSKYFMIDAAVAKESYDDTEEQLSNGGTMGMEHPEWAPYDGRLWCSDWHLLFAGGDNRSTLTWENRLENVGDVTAYNFYSTGEEVLKNPSSPPSLPLSANEVWNKQERMKGRMLTGQVLSSNYGGWAFNSMWNITDTSDPENPISHRRTPSETTEITSEQLKSNPFFSRGPGELYGANGSNYASPQQHRNTLLAEMIPALSYAAGSNPLTALAPPGGSNRNFNMMEYKEGWPRTSPDWQHSDVKIVAYIYIYKLYEKLVELGALKE